MTPLSDLQADWPAINQLLDEALAVPPAERGAWLAALPADAAGLKDSVTRLLAVQGGIETGDFMHTLPKLGAGAGAGALSGTLADAEVGPWRLLREIGEGGMGSVWLAERADGSLKRQVALKLPRISWVRGLAERMARERDILATLEHPHIARLYDAGVDALGRPWLALEYVEGKPIDEHARDKAMDVRQRVQLLLQVCEAVAYAHSRLVIHRDLKPSNILVTEAGQVNLLDFGIAKLAEASSDSRSALTELAGSAFTPGYASPEQLLDEPLSTASDVFSLGVVAYQLLAGRLPYVFSPQTAAAYERALAAGLPPLASRVNPDAAGARQLRGDLDAVVHRALQPEPRHRYSGADALAAELRAWLAGAAVQARQPGAGEQLRRWVGRHKVPVAAGVLALAALLLGTAVATWQALVAREQTAQAAAEAEKARKEAARARATQALLMSMFRLNSVDQPDPLKAQKTTARELLDLAAKSQAEVLKDAPEARLDVLENLAALYAQLGVAADSARLARERVALARRTLAPDDLRLADALLSLTGRLHDTPRRAEARALLEEAQAVLARHVAAAGSEASRSATTTGPSLASVRAALALQWARHERFSALASAQRHVDEAVLQLRATGQDSGLHLTALYFCGVIHELAGQLRRAAACLDEALVLGRQRGTAGRRATITGLADMGPLRERQGLLALAAQAHDDAVEASTQVYGAVHKSTLVLAIERVRFLYQHGQTTAAGLQWADIQARIQALQPAAESWWVSYANGLLERAEFERGNPARLEAPLRAAITNLQESVPESGALARRRLQLAEVLLALGRLDEAQLELDQADTLWRRFAAGVQPSVLDNRFPLARARLLRLRGEPAMALEALRQVVPGSAVEPGMPERDLLGADLERAAALLDLDRVGEAVTHARRALATARRVAAPYRWPALEADAELMLGRALGRLPLKPGQARDPEAGAALARAVALRLAHDAPGSLWLAEAQAELARAAPAGARTAAAQRSRR